MTARWLAWAQGMLSAIEDHTEGAETEILALRRRLKSDAIRILPPKGRRAPGERRPTPRVAGRPRRPGRRR